MSAFGTPFGQQSSAFGAASGFGANPAPFGSTNTPFGSQNAGTSLFGASQPQQSQPSGFGAFGQSSAFGGGGSVFGASSSAFGASAPAFGAASTPAFGASAPAFGASGFGSQQSSAFASPAAPFGASSSSFASSSLFGSSAGSSLFGNQQNSGTPFGGSSSVFGQSQPAWNTASSSAFGASATPFGASSSLFGAASSSSLFGGTQTGTGAFGSTVQQQQPQQHQQQQQGTAGVNWQITTEYDSNPGNQSSKYQSISMMQQFRDRSLEELRLEDYSIGNKDSSSNPSATGATTGGSLFGGAAQSAPSTGLFGGATTSTFAQTPAFGTAQNPTPFGTASSAGGLFGGGAAGGAGGGIFGGSSAPAQSGGGLFGASASAFGASQAQSTGGLFGAAQSSSPFGGRGNTAFGSSAPSFGQFSSSLFSQPSAFGPQSQGQAFGAASSSGGLFGGSAATGGSLFGQPAAGAQPTSGLFGAQPTPTAFGNPTQPQQPQQPSLFGQPAATNPPTGGLFGQTSSGFGGLSSFSAPAPAQQPNTGFGTSVFGSNAAQPNPAATLGGMPPVMQPSVPGAGNTPTLLDSYNAVINHNGTTVAPPGANYGTVLHNLQKIQDDLAKNNRLMEEQKKAQDTTRQKTDSLSVVVLPSPPLLTFGSNQLTLGGNNNTSDTNGGNSVRALGTGMGGALTVIGNRTSMGPLRTPVRNSNARVRYFDNEALGSHGLQQNSPNGLSPGRRRTSGGDATPFFTPKQFSGAKRRPLRGSEVATPVRTGPLLTPSSRGRLLLTANGRNSGSEAPTSGSRSRERNGKPLGNGDGDTERENSSGLVNRSNGTIAAENGRNRNGRDITSGDPGGEDAEHVEINNNSVELPRRSLGNANPQGVDNGQADMRNLLWSSTRPSQWSMRLGVRSQDQYDPAKYLPVNSRSGYYTLPSGSELAVMSVIELQHVKDFTIGRDGYGYIKWLEPVDVRGLIIDDCVEIERGEIAVMPDREASQLDAHARITLEGMTPRTKKGKVEDPVQTAKRYEKSLKRFCEHNSLKFISYDSETCVWQFDAERFKD